MLMVRRAAFTPVAKPVVTIMCRYYQYNRKEEEDVFKLVRELFSG